LEDFEKWQIKQHHSGWQHREKKRWNMSGKKGRKYDLSAISAISGEKEVEYVR